MSDDFEDHCWKDVITPDVLQVYSSYRRKVFVGARPALLAVDLYDVVYRGGPRPPAEACQHSSEQLRRVCVCRDRANQANCWLRRAVPAFRSSIRPAIRARKVAPGW